MGVITAVVTPARVAPGRGDGVAALRGIAIGGVSPHVEVLARQVPGPAWGTQAEPPEGVAMAQGTVLSSSPKMISSGPRSESWCRPSLRSRD